MKSKCPSWQGAAPVRSRRQGRRGVAFIGAERKPLTGGVSGSGAEFGQKGQTKLQSRKGGMPAMKKNGFESSNWVFPATAAILAG